MTYPTRTMPQVGNGRAPGDPEDPKPEWWEDWLRLRDLISTSRVPEARVLSKELAAKWPESDTLRHYAHVLEPPAVRRLPRETGRDFARDYAWIREHAREYPGRWLAAYEDRLIAADPDFQVVAAAAREAGLPGGALLHLTAGGF